MTLPSRGSFAVRAALAILGAFTASAAALPVGRPAPLPPAPEHSAQQSAIRATVVDAARRPVVDVRPDEFAVTVDGRPRRVVSAEWSTAARTVVFAVDTESLEPGSMAAVRAVAARILDGLSPADRVAIVSMPLSGSGLAWSTGPGELREQVAGIVPKAGVAGETQLTVAEAALLVRGDRRTIEDVLARTRRTPPVDRKVDDRTGEERRVEPESPMTDPPPELLSEAQAVLAEARARATTTVRSLTSLARALGQLPGPKTVVVVTAGFLVESTRQTAPLVEAAAAAGATLHILPVPASAWRNALPLGRTLDELAGATGGSLLPGGSAELVAEVVKGLLSADYRLVIAPAGSDADGRLHALEVTTRRPDTTVRAARLWAPEMPASPAGPTPDAASTGREAPPPRDAPAPHPAPAATTARSPDAALRAVLARAATYAAAYEQQFSSVVAEEHYEQAVEQFSAHTNRVLRSDFLFVKLPNEDGWVPFRDVFEVDGKPVRDREERLRRLFLEAPATAMREAARVTNEGARFNIGAVFRNVNLPTLPLMFLGERPQQRFEFRRRGEEVVNGRPAWRVDYRETARPTLVRTREGGDVPASGTFWLDPATGRVLRSLIVTVVRQRSPDRTIQMDTTVAYEPNGTLGIWVPAEMRETYTVTPALSLMASTAERAVREGAIQTIRGVATYSNFRRFQVITDEQIKPPTPAPAAHALVGGRGGKRFELGLFVESCAEDRSAGVSRPGPEC